MKSNMLSKAVRSGYHLHFSANHLVDAYENFENNLSIANYLYVDIKTQVQKLDINAIEWFSIFLN